MAEAMDPTAGDAVKADGAAPGIPVDKTLRRVASEEEVARGTSLGSQGSNENSGGSEPGGTGVPRPEGGEGVAAVPGEAPLKVQEAAAADGAGKGVQEASPQGRYVRLNELIGKGAYKEVWRAYDTIEGIEVAWNSVSLSNIPKVEKARIINEVKLLDQLEHENIIDFFGSWVNREREQVIFVTELMTSGSLKTFIEKVQVIRWKIIKRWCKQILKALDYLHSQVRGARRPRSLARAQVTLFARPLPPLLGAVVRPRARRRRRP